MELVAQRLMYRPEKRHKCLSVSQEKLICTLVPFFSKVQYQAAFLSLRKLISGIRDPTGQTALSFALICARLCSSADWSRDGLVASCRATPSKSARPYQSSFIVACVATRMYPPAQHPSRQLHQALAQSIDS